MTEALNRDGFRVVAVALREMTPLRDAYRTDDEREMTLVGYVAFLDPPKESAGPALQALAARGVAKGADRRQRIRDAQDLRRRRLPVTGRRRRQREVERMTDAELALAVRRANVFAKLNPLHKERIVRCLRASGQVVGYLGDGINDAAALHAADVGHLGRVGGGHREGGGRHRAAGKSLRGPRSRAWSRAARPSPTCRSTSA